MATAWPTCSRDRPDRSRRTGLPARRPAAPSRATSRRRCWSDAGATLVILGHSERRDLHGETDAFIAAQGHRRASGRSGTDRLRRGKPRSASGGRGRGRRASGNFRRLAPVGRSEGARLLHRLRADLGDRHRRDPDPRPDRGDPSRDPRRSSRRCSAKDGRAPFASPLWWVGQSRPTRPRFLRISPRSAWRSRRRRFARRRKPISPRSAQAA